MSGSVNNNNVDNTFKDANNDVTSNDRPTASFDQHIKKIDNS